MEARNAGDYALYIRNLEQALAEAPGQAILMRHLAQGYALAGDPDSAAVWLDRVAATGAWFDLSSYEELASLPDSPPVRAARDRVERNHEPAGTAAVAFRVPDPLLIPEGIAYDPRTETFFLSSVRQRKIVAADGKGGAQDFAADAGLYGGLGLAVDEPRRRLWAVSTAFEGMDGYTEEIAWHSALSCFDLDTGERLRHLDLSDSTSPGLSDLVVDGEGRVYATDGKGGGLYVLDPGAEELRTLLPAGTLYGPNGIALDGERGYLYVSEYGLDVVRVDVADGSVHALPRPSDCALFGVDGLYLHGGALIAVQNHPSLDRVARFSLSEDGRGIAGWEVLVARHPLFHEPTTGVPVGDLFYVIANSQIESMSKAETPHPGDFEETIVLEVELPR